MASMGIKFTPLKPGGFHRANDIDNCGITLAPPKKVDTSNLPLLWYVSNGHKFNWNQAPLATPNLKGFGVGTEGFPYISEQTQPLPISPCDMNSPSDEEYQAMIEQLSTSGDPFSFDQFISNPPQLQSRPEDNITQPQEPPMSLEDLEKMVLSLGLPPDFPLDEATLEYFNSCNSTSIPLAEDFDSFLQGLLSDPTTA